MLNPMKEAPIAEIKEHMEVISKDGTYIGIVDRIEEGRIKLTKRASPAGHQAHLILSIRSL